MKKWIIPLVLVVIIAFWGMNVNNTAVKLEESAKKSWSNVESSYQRRNDLIGNLVKTVQGAADFEKSTLEAVIKARAEASKPEININNAEDLSPENLARFQQAQSGLSSALSRLLVTVERYPDLKANQNFVELQSQLEGTENRINVARDRFNESVEPYNNHVRTFPNKIIAGILGFDEMGYYEAEAGAEKPVDVEFDFN
ncbi:MULTISPECIES: LemA family protein [Winogradskyella]|uniref:LemA family protein n=1 Tax=Winogradskyella ouciana TaxID=2608631 RepID=A0A7K1GFP7_9FLAO|nr:MULTISPECIES: LemA family protein [Winogradskyella]MBO6879084.1 LemA family protein [Winogradskyella sp.]MTE26699.1 LemA family protein [Winogradskyella ouciana]